MVVYVFTVTLLQLLLHDVFGIQNNDVISIQPMNPMVREGDNVILNCHSNIEGASVSWYQVSDSYSMFRSFERRSFPGGNSLHLISASRREGEETSTVSFLCVTTSEDRKLTSVTIVQPSSPFPVQSSLIVFPSNPVVENGSSISLTCIAPSANETDIGWYVPGDSLPKFSHHEIDKFDNGAHLRITNINVDSLEATISVVCLASAGGSIPLTETVTIRVTDMIPTTEASVDTKGPGISSSVTSLTTGTAPSDHGALGASGGVSTTLVLIAIAIGAGLAVFCICLIFLSVYTLFYFRSQSFEFLTKDTADDVFGKTRPRSIDNMHPYQSVTGGEGGAASKDGGVTGYADLNPYDVAGAVGKGPYTDLDPYEDPRVYMRLESESTGPTPAKREVNAPEGIYEGEIGVETTSFKHETTSQV